MSNVTKIALPLQSFSAPPFRPSPQPTLEPSLTRRATRPVAAWRPMLGTEALSRVTGTISTRPRTTEAATIAPLATSDLER